MSDYQALTVELHALMKAKHENKELKLLNVGTDNPDEQHWRCRTLSGEIINISMRREKRDD